VPSRTVTRQITAHEIRYVCTGYPYFEKGAFLGGSGAGESGIDAGRREEAAV